MKEILIITPGVLPIINHHGGAVESLIKSYLDVNEKEKKFNFTIYSLSTDFSDGYKYVNMQFINEKSLFYKISRIFRYIINHKLPYFYVGNAYSNAVIKKIKKNKEKYDTILIENNPLLIIPMKKAFPNAKFILHLHNDYLNSNTKQAKKVLSMYNKIIVVSDYIKSRIETIEKTDKIEVVYNGIDVKRFYGKVSEENIIYYKNKFGLTDNKKIVIYMGRIIKEKGVEELVIASRRLLEEGYDFYLLVVGNKNNAYSKKDLFMNKIMNIAKNQKNIIFTRFVPYKDIPTLLKLSDIQVIPSNWNEPVGNVVIEGNISGIRQIVTNDGGICEAVGKNSVIISKENLTENIYDALKKELEKEKIEKIYNEANLNLFSEENYSKKIFEIIEGEINGT